jgi:methionyl-tRNA formyltransferase
LLEADGVDVALACLCRPGSIGTRRLTRTLGAGRVLVKPDVTRPALAERVRALNVDLIVSWFWTTRIPRAVLELAPQGSVGVHPSLLPRHRGPDPYFWAIESGDAVTGVTAHRLADTYDTGAILAQRELAIDPTWSAWTLARKLDRPSLSLLREVVRGFASGAPPAERAQDERLATSAPEPRDALLSLSWDDPSDAIVRRIRAASPWPGAFMTLGDDVITITRAAVTDDFPRALEPGEAAVRADGVALVRAKDRAVTLLAGRDEDEGELDAAALAYLVAGASVPFSEGVL